MEGETDFQKIQQAFYDEWDGQTIERGKGYKQFKRWEHRNATRLKDGQIQNIACLFPQERSRA